VWFWPTIGAALTAKHPWLVIACDTCDTVIDLDLRVKPRDLEASVRVARRALCWRPMYSFKLVTILFPSFRCVGQNYL